MQITRQRLKKLLGMACATTAGLVAMLMGEAFAFKPMPGLEQPDMDAMIAEMQADALD